MKKGGPRPAGDDNGSGARVCTNRVVEVTWRGLAGRIEAAALSMYTTSASKAAISHANTRAPSLPPSCRAGERELAVAACFPRHQQKGSCSVVKTRRATTDKRAIRLNVRLPQVVGTGGQARSHGRQAGHIGR